VRSASSGVDATDGQEILRGPLVGTAPILVLLRGSRSNVAIMSSSLGVVRTVHGRPTIMCAVGISLPAS
jgi:hypothetical protein